MDITLDIGSAIIGVATVVVIPLVGWAWSRNRRQRQEDFERYQELKEAVDIHAALTSADVMAALKRADEDDEVKEVLVALHRRMTYRYVALKNSVSIPEDFDADIQGALGTIHERWEEETSASQDRFAKKLEATGKESRYESPWVQDRIVEFGSHLAGKPIVRGDSAEAAEEFKDLMHSVRLSKKGGQAVEMTLPDQERTIWFAGSGKGELPTEIRHREPDPGKPGRLQNTVGCKLNRHLKSELRAKSESGEQLGIAFIHHMRELARVSDTCECGVPYLFARD